MMLYINNCTVQKSTLQLVSLYSRDDCHEQLTVLFENCGPYFLLICVMCIVKTENCSIFTVLFINLLQWYHMSSMQQVCGKATREARL